MGPVFITGGAGFVGAHASKSFARAGREVVVYDNLSRGWADFVKWGPLVEGDILDDDALRSALSGCDTVFHLAANADVRFGLELVDFTELFKTSGFKVFASTATGGDFAAIESVVGKPIEVEVEDIEHYPSGKARIFQDIVALLSDQE